jgi:hypothetical protein
LAAAAAWQRQRTRPAPCSRPPAPGPPRPRRPARRQTALVEVTPARPVVVEEFSELRGMGRVALRDAGHTVAVGIITRVLAEK